MVLWQLLTGSGSMLTLRGDYPPGTISKTDSHLAIFMALFMVCAAEVFFIKIITFDMQQQQQNHQTQDTRNMINSFMFNVDM